ncbi:Uncharacterised protein [Legionella hackeliae]|uniref:Uncharacterized protein n=1 Tax=Legionella hackeliae TaxID=449 RepID=A0A0A8UXP7_LEGHA|nr:hypothetical protein Lhac_1039 [Legionella hackeliae]CEK11519.1 protein of unknown function [Legionella hackeliae]STX48287.1 Uncharacterised protein [Legionella hackeliae]
MGISTLNVIYAGHLTTSTPASGNTDINQPYPFYIELYSGASFSRRASISADTSFGMQVHKDEGSF